MQFYGRIASSNIWLSSVAASDDLRLAEDLMHKRVMLSRTQRWSKRGLTKCVMSWRAWALRKLAVRNMLRKVVLRLQSLRCACAFDGWSGWSARRRHVQSICTKAAARLQNLAVSKAWSAWWSLRCLMIRVRGMAIKMRHRAVMSAFGVWAYAVTTARTAALHA